MKRIVTMLLTASLLLCVNPGKAQDEEEFSDFDITIEESVDYGWNTPAGRYLDAVSFFSLHGYVNGVYAGKSSDWMSSDATQIGRPGQLLLPNTEKSSFLYDFALIFSSEMSDRARIAIETHYVSDPSGQGAAGPGGITIAVTEATGSYDLVPQYLTLSAGIFWSPFGIVNEDWLGAQNSFSMIPRASGAYPIHFNERGIRLNGVFNIGSHSAVNYVASIGNGVGQWDLAGQYSVDHDNGKTITARVGIFPGFGKDLEVGLSLMNGTMRNADDPALNLDEPMRYQARMSAFGIDYKYAKNNFSVRGYTIFSTEDLEEDQLGNSPADIDRKGIMAEIGYEIPIKTNLFKGIKPRMRFDRIKRDQLAMTSTSELGVQFLSTNVVSYGFDLIATKNIRLAFDYNVAREKGQSELDNDRFVGKFIAQF